MRIMDQPNKIKKIKNVTSLVEKATFMRKQRTGLDSKVFEPITQEINTMVFNLGSTFESPCGALNFKNFLKGAGDLPHVN